MSTTECKTVKIEEWMEFFKKNRRKKIFSTSDLVLLTGEDRPSLSVALSRLVATKLIERPVRGWYVNPFNTPTDEELAMVIRDPSYLSLEYALSKHNILSQTVFTYTLITTKLPYSFRTEGKIFEYHQVKRDLFWGYRTEGDIKIAEPEKALLDLLYVRYVKGRGSTTTLTSLMDDMYLEDLNKKKIAAYSKRYDKKTQNILSEKCSCN